MPSLTPSQRGLLAASRRAVLGTVDPSGRPRLVPVCFALDPGRLDRPDEAPVIWTPLDEKPKAAVDVRALARVRDLLARPRVTLLVDRWDEDWSRLAWLRLLGTATLVEPDGPEADAHARAVRSLRVRYPRYANQALETLPMIRIAVERVVGWEATPRS
jgi:PPOX class probable F420-dependent enzyme